MTATAQISALKPLRNTEGVTGGYVVLVDLSLNGENLSLHITATDPDPIGAIELARIRLKLLGGELYAAFEQPGSLK